MRVHRPIRALMGGAFGALVAAALVVVPNANATATWNPTPNLALSYDAEDRVIGSNGLIVVRDANGRLGSITYAVGKIVKRDLPTEEELAALAEAEAAAAATPADDAG